MSESYRHIMSQTTVAPMVTLDICPAYTSRDGQHVKTYTAIGTELEGIRISCSSPFVTLKGRAGVYKHIHSGAKAEVHTDL